ncbi:MAG: hypothetical protein PT116_13995 [Aphanizomenon gracile PMC638.10]|nr:hypothetical protein [Aphanizomenon gracile PMC638.10]
MYVGKTPENTADVPGKKLKQVLPNKTTFKKLIKLKAKKQSYAVYPPEERVSRAEMRTQGKTTAHSFNQYQSIRIITNSTKRCPII